MPQIKFSNDEKAALVRKIQDYFNRELDQDIAQFPAEFLLDFFTAEIGPYYYNRGLLDARAVLAKETDRIDEAIDQLELQTPDR